MGDSDKGNGLSVAVGSDPVEELGSCPDVLDGCVQTDAGLLAWQEEEPEEDPGVVLVLVRKPRGAVVVFQSTQKILGDPREQDLQISVAEMFAVANDVRVDVTTSKAAIEGGADLSYWRGRD